ncbi:MAG: hypothetical protein K9N21_19155 [Deltaproteobacteria bacterium]|nr:hypothetical protein [Deltaproteobacteria bacterium]
MAGSRAATAAADQGDHLLPIEIKPGKTVSENFFKGLRFWSRISRAEAKERVLAYGG